MDKSIVFALGMIGTGLALIGFSTLRPLVPTVVWNASASMPKGFYRTVSDIPQRGDTVLARLPETVAALAAERGYLPPDVPLVKRIAAVSGDKVCVIRRAVFINGHGVAKQRELDNAGEILPLWRGCRRLDSGEVFLLGEAPDSFDSRYFGPVANAALIGRLVPLWTE